MGLTKYEKIVEVDMVKRGFEVIRNIQKGYPDFKVFNFETKQYFYLEAKTKRMSFTHLQKKTFPIIKEQIVIAIIDDTGIKYEDYQTKEIIFETILNNPKVKIDNNIKCVKCNYAWYTNSKMVLVSCPSCGNKVKIREINSNQTNKKEDTHSNGNTTNGNTRNRNTRR